MVLSSVMMRENAAASSSVDGSETVSRRAEQRVPIARVLASTIVAEQPPRLAAVEACRDTRSRADMLAIWQAAARVEHNPDQAAGWYQHIRIAELDDLTAAQLVARGRAGDVLLFLEAVSSGARD